MSITSPAGANRAATATVDQEDEPQGSYTWLDKDWVILLELYLPIT